MNPILACDWNGTLVDDSERAWCATLAVLEKRGLDGLSLEAFLREFRLPLAKLFASLGVVQDDLEHAERDWNDAMRAQPPPVLMPHAIRMLDGMSALGVSVVVISAATEDLVRSDAEAVGVLDQLSLVVGSVSKKREALATLRNDGNSVVVAYVGDTEYDIDEANAAGVPSIGYSGGYRPAAVLSESANHVVSSLVAIVPLVQGLLSNSREPSRGS